MILRITILILLLFADFWTASAQKKLQGFDGDLIFKEAYYYYLLSRKTYDTAFVFSYYEVGQMITIEQYSPISINDSYDISFLPVKFYINKDSVFYKYADPYDIDHDTTSFKLFPLSFNDTIDSEFCYKITMDTIRGSDENRTLTIRTDCQGDNIDIKTYRTKDTIFTFKDYLLDCYAFEQKALLYNDIFFTRVILVDKNTLIPLDVKEYNFHTRHITRIKNSNQGKNFLTFHQKLISIE